VTPSPPRSHLLLFDIDGTLLLSDGAGQRSMLLAGRQLFGADFDFHGLDVAGMIDPQIYEELTTLNPGLGMNGRHDHFRDRYLEVLEQELERVGARATTLPGVIDGLRALRRSGQVVLGLLTGNYPRAARLKLQAVGLENSWFEITAFGSEARARAELVPLAMRRYRDLHGRDISPRRVVVIGDTPRDVACAQEHGCVAFAVATGNSSAAELRAAGAEVVVESLSDLSPLLELIGTT